MDVRIYQGTNLGSDHYLTVAKLWTRIFIVNNQWGTQHKIPNVKKVKEPKVKCQFSTYIDSKVRNINQEKYIIHHGTNCKTYQKQF